MGLPYRKCSNQIESNQICVCVRVCVSLVEEVYEITETVEQLRAKLREAEKALQHLLRTKMSLEHDLTVKNNSIYIDREVCLGKRKKLPLSVSVVY